MYDRTVVGSKKASMPKIQLSEVFCSFTHSAVSPTAPRIIGSKILLVYRRESSLGGIRIVVET